MKTIKIKIPAGNKYCLACGWHTTLFVINDNGGIDPCPGCKIFNAVLATGVYGKPIRCKTCRDAELK